MKKQILFAVVIGIGFISVFGFIKYLQIAQAIAESQKFAPPPDAVTTAVAKELAWPRVLESVASLAAVEGVILQIEEPGTISKIHFDSGEQVEKGQLILELDTSVEEADLAGVQARMELSRLNLKRAESLRSNKANSAADLDTAVSQFKDAEAATLGLKARIARKKLVAPFTGRTGIRHVNVGQFVSAGTAVVPLFSIDNLYADFTLPQQSIASLSVGLSVTLLVDAYPDKTFSGVVNAIDPQIDERSRTVKVQATVPNAEGLLRPGMFVKANLILPNGDSVVVIPTSSVSFAPYGDSVFVIQEGKSEDGTPSFTVRQQIIKLGDRRGDLIAVLDGLALGEQVVSSGTFKLRPGGPVTINNSVQPGSEIAPLPKDT